MLRWAIGSLVITTACASGSPAPRTAEVSTAAAVEPARDETPTPLPESPSASETTLEVRADAFLLNGRLAGGHELAQLLAAEPTERVVVVTAEASLGWARVIVALDHLRRYAGDTRSFVLAVSGDAERRTQPLSFPRTSEIGAPPAEPPPPGEALPPMLPMLVVTIDRDGHHYIAGRLVAEDFESELGARIGDHERVAIQADRDTAIGTVIDVTRVAQALGAKVAFAVAVS